MHNETTYAARLEFDKILALTAEYAVSDDAKRAIGETVPATQLYIARQQLELTDALYVQFARSGSPAISSAKDVAQSILRAEKGGVLSMGELLRVKELLKNGRALKSWYADAEGSGEADRLFYMLYEDAPFERQLGDSILSETEMSDDASGELRAIRRAIARTESSIRDKLDSIIHSADSTRVLQDAIVTMRGGRFVVPVKVEHKNALQGLVHDVSASGSTYFIEPAAVVEANNKIMQLKGDERKEIDRILTMFSEQVAAVAGRLRDSHKAFVELDIALAKAKYGAAMQGICPALNDEGRIRLVKARHPLIPKNQVVPIDVTLGEDYTALIITGPNTGGKTVTLKTVGLLTLMASSGFLVTAAESSELSVFEQVLVDIGDEQSIEQSLSTFSAHIRTISAIMGEATDRSLVLMDELGAGTDPAEGAALAISILERLRGFGCRIMATTHYGELKVYALETEGVQNASCEFDVATLRPTYRLLVGIPGRSNALLIGERLGLDKALLDEARRQMKADDRRFEDVLDEIERLKSELASKQDEIEAERTRAADLVKKAEQEKEKLLAEGEKALAAARLKAKQLSADVSANAYRLLDEIKKLEREKEADIKAAKARAKAIANNDSAKLFDMGGSDLNTLADSLPPLTTVKAGDRVYVAALGGEGIAMGAPDAKGMVEVKAGIVKTRVALKDLRQPPAAQPQKKKPQSKPVVRVGGMDKRSSKNEINLLGMTVDEAILEVDRFIDHALLSHFNMVYIIHGKGTGALRNGIHTHLRTLKQVKSFRLGQYGEGESGVTIVELK